MKVKRKNQREKRNWVIFHNLNHTGVCFCGSCLRLVGASVCSWWTLRTKRTTIRPTHLKPTAETPAVSCQQRTTAPTWKWTMKTKKTPWVIRRSTCYHSSLVRGRPTSKITQITSVMWEEIATLRLRWGRSRPELETETKLFKTETWWPISSPHHIPCLLSEFLHRHINIH